MTPIAERTLTITVITCVLGAWAYNSWVIQPEKEQQRYEKEQQRYAERKAKFAQRVKDWAYVAKEKDIAPGETIKLIVIPDSTGIISTKCFVYTHREFKTSSMICPDAKQDDIEESVE